MARYSKKRSTRSGVRSRNAGRGNGRRTYASKSPARRTGRSTNRRGGQTIRIVLEQPGGASAGVAPANMAAALRLLAGDKASAAARVRADKPRN